MNPAQVVLEHALRRDRALVIASLVGVIALAWAYTVAGVGMGMSAFEMTPPLSWSVQDAPIAGSQGVAAGGMPMPMARPGGAPARGPVYASLLFAMWWIMMVAMMLPSAAPMILLYTAVGRRQRARGRLSAQAPPVQAGWFTAGYLVVWGGFSAAAAAAQWVLEHHGLLSSMMSSTSTVLGALALIAAGVWQLTPLKRACLEHCRAPVQFLSRHWRPGRTGALRMGIEHGAFCLGCCWFLMGLLFYGGVMNLYWIAGLAAYVLLEKSLPAVHALRVVTGVALLAWGLTLLTTTIVIGPL